LRKRCPAVSDERNRWEAARAKREEVKALRQAGQLCWVSEFKELTDSVAASALVHLGAIAPRVAPRDLELRKRIEAGVREAQNGMAADMRRLGDDLKGKDGKAA
jgi:hypothetical protein